MKTFKMLNHTVSFNEGIIDYIKIMQAQHSYKVNFDARYWSTPQKNIVKMEDFALYVQELYNNGFAEEYMNLSEEIINIYIMYGIYDMSKNLIQATNISSLNTHLKKMEPILDEIADFTSQVTQGVVDIEAKWKNIVDDAVPGLYFDMYSSSYTDLLLNDYFNHKEEKRVAKKRQRLYTENASKTVNDYLSQVIPLCYEYINKIQQVIYEDVIETIDTMYRKCAMDLVAKGKISPFSQYTDSLKSNAILDNINKITSKEVIETQLINLLQIDSFNIDIHFKIVEYITYNDIPEYVELIKFLKLQNLIFYMYADNYSRGERKDEELNNKYLTILKSMKDNFDLEELFSNGISTLNYTHDFFIDSVKAAKIYFECLKHIFGIDNKIINEKEQSMFIKAIKEASKGTNLIYDGSINRLDYDYLCEFWKKAEKQHNNTIKRKEIVQKSYKASVSWGERHIKLIIFIIIICIIYLYSKGH